LNNFDAVSTSFVSVILEGESSFYVGKYQKFREDLLQHHGAFARREMNDIIPSILLRTYSGIIIRRLAWQFHSGSWTLIYRRFLNQSGLVVFLQLGLMLLTVFVVAGTLGGANAFRISPSVQQRFACHSRLFMSDGDAGDENRGLISIARTFAASNLGVSDPSLLSEDFVCSGPSFVLGNKQSYVSGLKKETQVFEQAIPDFDLRPYSFVVDEKQPDTVWFKIKPRGTITGPFAYGGEVYPANNKVVELPIQQCSVTIRNGQVCRSWRFGE
jgi:hypothetical protein